MTMNKTAQSDNYVKGEYNVNGSTMLHNIYHHEDI